MKPCRALVASIPSIQAKMTKRVVRSTSTFIFPMLVSVMFGMYPYILVSTTNLAFSLTVFNASTDSYGLTAGIGWFGVGFLLILAYQIYLHSQFLGKTRPEDVH